MLINLRPLRKHRDFRFLYFGQAVSYLGSMMSYVAIPYQVYQLTGSSFSVGLLGTVQLIPLLLAALWGGALADAMDRRKLLLRSELLMTLGAGALAVNAWLPQPSLWLIFVVTGALSAINGFHRPALDSLTPRLVDREDLPAIAALGSLRFSVGSIVGPAIGGILIAGAGLGITYVLDTLSFAVSLWAIWKIRAIPVATDAAPPSLKAIWEGIDYARKRPELVGTYLVDIVAMTFAMPMALFPALAEGWGGAQAAGWLYSAMSIGSLVLTILSGWTSKVRRHGAAVILAAALWGVAIIGLGFAPNLATAVLCLAVAGAADMVSGIFRGTIWNETIPTELRGRLAGVEMISYMSGPLLGNARAGWVASVSSNSLSILSGGVLCVAGVLLCIPLLPGFWRYRADSKSPS